MPQNDLEQPQSAGVTENEASVDERLKVAEESSSGDSVPSTPSAEDELAQDSIEEAEETAFEGDLDEGDEKFDDEATEVSRPQSSYLEDDEEAILASSDTVLHSDGELTIVQQEEAVVKWDIQGLYDERGKVRSKRSLRNNPPVFVVSDSNGEEATFILTKELSAALARNFENANRAYYGIKPRDEMKFSEKLGEAKQGLRENMGKAIVIGGLLLGLLIFGLLF